MMEEEQHLLKTLQLILCRKRRARCARILTRPDGKTYVNPPIRKEYAENAKHVKEICESNANIFGCQLRGDETCCIEELSDGINRNPRYHER